jgi:hypothetical protein
MQGCGVDYSTQLAYYWFSVYKITSTLDMTTVSITMKRGKLMTSKKGRLNNGPYCLPKLQDIVVPVATENNGATCCTKSKILGPVCKLQRK